MTRQGARRNSTGDVGALPTSISAAKPASTTCLSNGCAPSECKSGDPLPDVPLLGNDPGACVSDQVKAVGVLPRMASGYPKFGVAEKEAEMIPTSLVAQRDVANASPSA